MSEGDRRSLYPDFVLDYPLSIIGGRQLVADSEEYPVLSGDRYPSAKSHFYSQTSQTVSRLAKVATVWNCWKVTVYLLVCPSCGATRPLFPRRLIGRGFLCAGRSCKRSYRGVSEDTRGGSWMAMASGKSSEQVANHVTVDIGEAEVAALVACAEA